MPKYNFVCSACGHSLIRFVSVSVETYECPMCGQQMNRQFPNISDSTEVRELVDPYLNRRLNKDHKDLIKDRREKYYWEVEVPRLVQKYSLQTCLEQGWLKYNDKGELVINKPPSKR